MGQSKQINWSWYSPQIKMNLRAVRFYLFGTMIVVSDFFCSSVGSFSLPWLTSSFRQCKINQASEKKIYWSPYFCILCKCFGVSFKTALTNGFFNDSNSVQCLSLMRSPIAISALLISVFSSQTICVAVLKFESSSPFVFMIPFSARNAYSSFESKSSSFLESNDKIRPALSI